MDSKHLVIITCSEYPNLFIDEQPLLNALAASFPHITVSTCIWDDPLAEHSIPKDAVILIRNPWDYVEKAEKFKDWLMRISHTHVLFNDAQTILWNMHKSYLLDIEARGVKIVPSVLVNKSDCVDGVFAVMKQKQWSSVVVKPCVGAGGVNVVKLYSDDVSNEIKRGELSKILQSVDVLVQPYLCSIKQRGEVSVVMIAGEITHAVLWKPVKNDFSLDYSTSRELYQLSDEQKEIAMSVVQKCQQCAWKETVATCNEEKSSSYKPYLYGRVDFLFDEKDVPLVSEVELFEPSLFFQYYPACGEALASAINKLF